MSSLDKMVAAGKAAMDSLPDDARDFVAALLAGEVGAFALIWTPPAGTTPAGEPGCTVRWAVDHDGTEGDPLQLLGAVELLKADITGDMLAIREVVAGLDDDDEEDDE